MIKVSWTNMKCCPSHCKLLAAPRSCSDSSQLEECPSQTCCPACGHRLVIEDKQKLRDWPGLPSGVKFDPSDQELIEHLEAQVGLNNSVSHPLIDEFIPTLEGEDGICCTHPEKLPGTSRDGLVRHFFHRPSRAYTTGTRKRRKIQSTDNDDSNTGETRWHKTGKTRPVLINGKQRGCKKILVLYTNFGKHRKPQKTNWVMHQYHLGCLEEERDGELVVSKIFYQTQPRQCSSDPKTADTLQPKSLVSDESSASTKDTSSIQFMQHERPSHYPPMLADQEVEALQSTTQTESIVSSEQETANPSVFLGIEDSKNAVTRLACYESLLKEEALSEANSFPKLHVPREMIDLPPSDLGMPFTAPHHHTSKLNHSQQRYDLTLEDALLNYYSEIKEEAFAETEESDWARYYSLWQDSGYGYGWYDCRRLT